MQHGLAADEAVSVAAFEAEEVRAAVVPVDRRPQEEDLRERVLGRGRRRFADRAHARGARVTVTLHDLSQPSDGVHFEVRADAYRQVCRTVDGIVTSSEHERMLLAELGAAPADLAVVPLPVPSVAAGPPVVRSQ